MNAWIAILSAMVIGAGCKKTTGADVGSSSVSSVSIQVPAQVAGKVNKARLVANTATLGSDRTFEEAIAAGATGGSVISFQRDTRNENIKVGDNLYTVTLELLNGTTVVYSGQGSINPFIIKPGENRVSFSLNCKDSTVCPTGSDLQVLQVQGVSADPAKAPKILADITIAEQGTNEGQRRQLLSGCQEQVKKKSCEQWQADFADGRSKCQSILAADAAGVCAGAGKIRTCLDDYIKMCQEMGVISK